MKFIEENPERAFVGLLRNDGFPQHCELINTCYCCDGYKLPQFGTMQLLSFVKPGIFKKIH